MDMCVQKKNTAEDVPLGTGGSNNVDFTLLQRL